MTHDSALVPTPITTHERNDSNEFLTLHLLRIISEGGWEVWIDLRFIVLRELTSVTQLCLLRYKKEYIEIRSTTPTQKEIQNELIELRTEQLQSWAT
jgi:hypothetical protein